MIVAASTKAVKYPIGITKPSLGQGNVFAPSLAVAQKRVVLLSRSSLAREPDLPKAPPPRRGAPFLSVRLPARRRLLTVNLPKCLAVQRQRPAPLCPAGFQSFPQHCLEGIHIQVLEHPVQGGDTGRPPAVESQQPGGSGPLVPAPLRYGVQAAGTAQHGADRQGQTGRPSYDAFPAGFGGWAPGPRLLATPSPSPPHFHAPVLKLLRNSEKALRLKFRRWPRINSIGYYWVLSVHNGSPTLHCTVGPDSAIVKPGTADRGE